MPGLASSYADKCWNLSNAVTGFAAAQSVVFSTTSQSHDIHIQLVECRGWWVAFGLILIFNILYAIAVWRCFAVESRLLADLQEESSTLREYVIGKSRSSRNFRLLTILVFALVSILSIVGAAREGWYK